MFKINKHITLSLFLLVSSQAHTMHHVTEFTNACEEKNEEKAKEAFCKVSLHTQKIKTLKLLFFKVGQLVEFNEKTKLLNILTEIKQNLKLETIKKEYKKSNVALEQIKKVIEEKEKEHLRQCSSAEKHAKFDKKIDDFFHWGETDTPLDLPLAIAKLPVYYLLVFPPAVVHAIKKDDCNSKAKEIEEELSKLEKSKAKKYEDTLKLQQKILQQKERYNRFLRGIILTLMLNKNISCHKCKTVKEPKELVLSCDKEICSQLLCKECKPTFDANTCTECCKKTDPRDHMLDLLNTKIKGKPCSP